MASLTRGWVGVNTDPWVSWNVWGQPSTVAICITFILLLCQQCCNDYPLSQIFPQITHFFLISISRSFWNMVAYFMALKNIALLVLQCPAPGAVHGESHVHLNGRCQVVQATPKWATSIPSEDLCVSLEDRSTGMLSISSSTRCVSSVWWAMQLFTCLWTHPWGHRYERS